MIYTVDAYRKIGQIKYEYIFTMHLKDKFKIKMTWNWTKSFKLK